MNYIIAASAAALVFMLFPVFLSVNVFADIRARRMYFSFYILRMIKVYGGYATLYDEGIAFHLTKNKAVLLPYREILSSGKKFAITRGFYVFAYSHTLEIGSENVSAAIALSALSQVACGIAAGYVFSSKKCASFKTDLIVYPGEGCCKASARIVLVFNFLILSVAAFKLFLRKILERKENANGSC